MCLIAHTIDSHGLRKEAARLVTLEHLICVRRDLVRRISVVNTHLMPATTPCRRNVNIDLILDLTICLDADKVFGIGSVHGLRQFSHLIPLPALCRLRQDTPLLNGFVAIVSLIYELVSVNHGADAACGVQGALPTRMHVCLAQRRELRHIKLARALVRDYLLLSLYRDGALDLTALVIIGPQLVQHVVTQGTPL